MTSQLIHIQSDPYDFTCCTPSKQRYFKRYLRYLEIDTVDQFTTLEELKSFAKQQYRVVIRKFHPDSSLRLTATGFHRRTGQSYQRIIEAYRWITSLTDLDFKIGPQSGSVPTEVQTPWHWDRSNSIPLGFQEDMSRYHY